MLTKDTNENQSLWLHSSFVIFSEVQSKKLPVDVRCGVTLDEDSVDVALNGFFSKIEDNNLVTFTVSKITPLDGKKNGDEKNCSFSFIYDIIHPAGGIEKLNFSGRGTIVEIKKSADEKIAQLVLRLAPHLTTSKTRRDQRLMWKNEDTKVLWSMIVPEHPENMEQFRTYISGHYNKHKTNTSAELKDISASGVCLRVKESMLEKKLFLNDYHLLFFVPVRASGNPFVFLAKKVGAERKCDDGTADVHLRYCYELDWSKSKLLLTWVDIQGLGSERVRHLIKDHKKNSSPPLQSPQA